MNTSEKTNKLNMLTNDLNNAPVNSHWSYNMNKGDENSTAFICARERYKHTNNAQKCVKDIRAELDTLSATRAIAQRGASHPLMH